MKAQSFIRKGFFILTALCLSMGGQSCLDDDDNNLSLSHYYANALVTVKQSADNTPYLQLDDSTTLRPVNMTTSPFGILNWLTQLLRSMTKLYSSTG